ncbi:MAG: TlpA family protein disulfide reductase [Spirochaetales bacterium]|nr:TlpA family protein disulfide reductase [Spirochaetales bacterium]
MKNHIFILITILLLVGCTKKEPEIKKSSPLENIGINVANQELPAPDFKLVNLESKNVSLSDYKGKIVVLNFWASWCGPCVQEMPSLENLSKLSNDLNFVVLAVNVGETKETVSSFIKDKGYEMNILLDSNKAVSNNYGIRSIPTTYILDKNGNIVAGKLGSYEWDNDDFISALKEMK